MAALPAKRCPECGHVYPADFRVCPRDATELADLAREEIDPLLGVTLGDSYRLMRVIGEGGMGRVYEAEHVRLTERRFAIKMMHKMYATQPELVSRFRREAETAHAISHPNVLEVFDVHQNRDGIPYMVTELLTGEDLGQVLDRIGKLDERTTARIIAQVCRALGAAHSHGVVHRDMKPENVFVIGGLESPMVKLLDFGIAKVELPDDHLKTRTGLVMGTPAYMAPEQAQGLKVDQRADIYAVGAMLYRAVTGRLPYDKEDPTQMLSALLTEAPPRPKAIEPRVSDAFELVIQKAMARDPTDRYQDMIDLEAELAAFDSGSEAAQGGALVPRIDLALRTVGSGTRTIERAREARFARPWIVASGLFLAIWAYAGLVEAISSAVVLQRGADGIVTGTEMLLLAIGALAGLGTPSVLWGRQVARNAWHNSVQALSLARSLRLVVGPGLATYGAGALIVQFIEALFGAGTVAGPLARLVCVGASALAGFVGWVVARRSAPS